MKPSEPSTTPAEPGAARPAHLQPGRWLAGFAAAAVAVAGIMVLADAQNAPRATADNPALVRGAGGTAERHPVRLRQSVTPPRVDTGRKDSQGNAVTVACGTCHATSAPRRESRRAADLDEFHQGLQYAHGDLTCLSCHDATDYDALRLADGRSLPFAETMALCAQCHGPQYRDYVRGSHGGMTGYWDLTRGPRERNHCVDCHDPHAPAYPEVMPTFPLPPDRGLVRRPSSAPHHD